MIRPTTLYLYTIKIETWGLPIVIRAYDLQDAVMLTRILFEIATDV
jgi:hypothetical protein